MSGKADRLRSFSKKLKEIPLNQRVSGAEWESWVEEAELTNDDLEQLTVMRDGYLTRASTYAQKALFQEAVEEWTNALQLFPADYLTLKAVIDAQSLVGRGTEDTVEFQKLLMMRRKFFPRLPKLPQNGKKLTLPVLVALGTLLVLFLGIALGAVYKFVVLDSHTPSEATGKAGEPTQIRRLTLTIDTQGVKYKSDAESCKLLSYPEAHVIETRSWISFPENQITEWTADVLILDNNQQQLYKKTVVLKSDQDPPLVPGQAMEFFQQIDAMDWHDRANEVFVRTVSIKAKGVEQTQKKKMTLSGEVPEGLNLEINLYESTWKTLFDRSINTLNLEIYNNGLKPIKELLVDLVWKDSTGNLLKTKSLRPVSAYRAELPSGARIPLQVEGEFPSEIFSWPEGQEPHPEVIIKKAQ